MKKLTEKIKQFIENFKNVHAEARKIGFDRNHAPALERSLCGRSLLPVVVYLSPCQVFP